MVHGATGLSALSRVVEVHRCVHSQSLSQLSTEVHALTKERARGRTATVTRVRSTALEIGENGVNAQWSVVVECRPDRLWCRQLLSTVGRVLKRAQQRDATAI